MDYTPPIDPFFQKQHSFLDSTIEQPRNNNNNNNNSAFKPQHQFRSSPLRRDSILGKANASSPLKPKQSYNITNANGSPQRAHSSHKVPIDQEVQLTRNLTGQVKSELETLKKQNRVLRKEKELLTDYSTGMKEKLIKYKRLYEDLKVEFEVQKREFEKQKAELDSLKNANSNDKKKQSSQEEEEKSAASSSELKNVRFEHEDVNEEKFSPRKKQEEKEQEPQQVKSVLVSSSSSSSDLDLKAELDEIKKILMTRNDRNSMDFYQYVDRAISSLKSNPTTSNTKTEEEPEPGNDTETMIKNDPLKNFKSKTPSEDELIVQDTKEVELIREQVLTLQHKMKQREKLRQEKLELSRVLESLKEDLSFDDLPESEKRRISNMARSLNSKPNDDTSKKNPDVKKKDTDDLCLCKDRDCHRPHGSDDEDLNTGWMG